MVSVDVALITGVSMPEFSRQRQDGTSVLIVYLHLVALDPDCFCFKQAISFHEFV